MAGWNGSGTFTKTYSWVSDAANGIKIRADRHDQNDTDFTSGINNCITKDGQNSPSADLPMNSQKHTGVSNATARDNYVTMGQFQDAGGVYIVTTGSADVYVASPTPAITAYAAGQRFFININATNTGATTINFNAVGAKSIVKDGSSALVGGELVSGSIYIIEYDGTNFQLLNPTLNLGTDDDVTFKSVKAYRPIVTETGTSKTLALSDANTFQQCSNASTQTITIPPNSSVAFNTGTEVEFWQEGAGTVTIAAGAGVTIRSDNSLLSLSSQYVGAVAKKIGTDEWLLVGNLA